MVQHVPEKVVPETKIAVWTPWGCQKARKTGKRDRIPSPTRPNEFKPPLPAKPRITAA